MYRKYCYCNTFQVATDLLNSENLKVAIAQLSYDLQVCNFTMLQLTQKELNNIFQQNSINAIVFKLQVIYSIGANACLCHELHILLCYS